MKVLFYRYNSIVEPDLLNAFDKIGLEVIELTVEMHRKDIPGKERVRMLLEAIVREKPLFVFSVDFFPFISMVCERQGIIYAALSVDCPVAEIYSPEIKNKCNRLYLFDEDQYDSVKDLNPGHIFYMPLGGATERLSKIPFPEHYEYGVSFIGSLYNEKDRYEILKKQGKIDAKAVSHMEELISAQLSERGLDIIDNGLSPYDVLALKKADPSFYECEGSVIDMDRYIAVNNYLGNHLTSLDRIRVIGMLAENLPKGSVHLFTGSDTSVLNPDVVVHGGVDTLKEMPVVFKSSIINLNLTSRTIMKGLPQRIWDIMGCNAFCVTDGDRPLIGSDPVCPVPGDAIINGVHLKTFSDYDELADICAYYLDHVGEAEEIAEKGFETVNSCHTVLQRALVIVKNILSEQPVFGV